MVGRCLLPFILCTEWDGLKFDGTLKAKFPDYFPQETECAFANIILCNGLAEAIEYLRASFIHQNERGSTKAFNSFRAANIIL